MGEIFEGNRHFFISLFDSQHVTHVYFQFSIEPATLPDPPFRKVPKGFEGDK